MIIKDKNKHIERRGGETQPQHARHIGGSKKRNGRVKIEETRAFGMTEEHFGKMYDETNHFSDSEELDPAVVSLVTDEEPVINVENLTESVQKAVKKSSESNVQNIPSAYVEDSEKEIINDGVLIPQNYLFNLIEYLEQEIKKDKPVWYGDGNYYQTSIYDGELMLLNKIKDLQEKAFGMTPDECYESYKKSQENQPKRLVKTKKDNK